MNNRLWALILAVVHHGAANLAEKVVPAGKNSVMDTALDFEDHLDGVPINERGRRPRR